MTDFSFYTEDFFEWYKANYLLLNKKKISSTATPEARNTLELRRNVQ